MIIVTNDPAIVLVLQMMINIRQIVVSDSPRALIQTSCRSSPLPRFFGIEDTLSMIFLSAISQPIESP